MISIIPCRYYRYHLEKSLRNQHRYRYRSYHPYRSDRRRYRYWYPYQCHPYRSDKYGYIGIGIGVVIGIGIDTGVGIGIAVGVATFRNISVHLPKGTLRMRHVSPLPTPAHAQFFLSNPAAPAKPNFACNPNSLASASETTP